MSENKQADVCPKCGNLVDNGMACGMWSGFDADGLVYIADCEACGESLIAYGIDDGNDEVPPLYWEVDSDRKG